MADFLLYDQHGRPIVKQKAPERRPLAVAPMADSFRDYVTDGLTPERLATVFKEADRGNVRRQAELFEQLEEKDLHLLCERDKRKNIILDLDFTVEPASDDARDTNVADFVRDFFDNMADWDDCLTSLQDAVGKGYAALEPFWDVSEGQAMPKKFEFLEQTRFTYLGQDGLLRKHPLLVSDAHPQGEEIPAWKTVFHSYGGKSGNPMRAGLYRVASWMILFKHYSIKDWVIFCEVFGMPLRLGKYSSGATDDDKSALISAISSLGTDAAGIISKETEIEFIETVRTASSDLYKTMASFCNAEISKGILGQTLSAEIGETGSYAASKTHDGIRLDLLQADGRALAATIRNQIIRPLVGFNFGWDTELPEYKAVLEEDEDFGVKSEWFERVTDKMAVPARWAREQFRIPEPEEGEEMIGGAPVDRPTPQAAKLVVAKQETPPGMSDKSEIIDQLTEQAIAETDLDPLLGPVKALLDDCASLEEFRDRLVEVSAGMKTTELAKVMQRALTMAEMSGRYVQSQEG